MSTKSKNTDEKKKASKSESKVSSKENISKKDQTPDNKTYEEDYKKFISETKRNTLTGEKEGKKTSTSEKRKNSSEKTTETKKNEIYLSSIIDEDNIVSQVYSYIMKTNSDEKNPRDVLYKTFFDTNLKQYVDNAYNFKELLIIIKNFKDMFQNCCKAVVIRPKSKSPVQELISEYLYLFKDTDVLKLTDISVLGRNSYPLPHIITFCIKSKDDSENSFYIHDIEHEEINENTILMKAILNSLIIFLTHMMNYENIDKIIIEDVIKKNMTFQDLKKCYFHCGYVADGSIKVFAANNSSNGRKPVQKDGDTNLAFEKDGAKKTRKNKMPAEELYKKQSENIEKGLEKLNLIEGDDQEESDQEENGSNIDNNTVEENDDEEGSINGGQSVTGDEDNNSEED